MKGINPDINIIGEAEKFTDSIFRQKDDLSLIFREGKSGNKIEQFEDLCFTGKYVNGLLRVIRNAETNPEVGDVNIIKKDLSENMNKVISLIKEITLNSSDQSKKILSDKYFSFTSESFRNLTELVSDLDSVKKYLNHLKRDT